MRVRRIASGFTLLALFALAPAAWASPARQVASTTPHPVVVELFTSQGCSDCPAADHILSELARRPDIVALTLPITYWDMLGWKDTFATVANTKRQRAYAWAMRRSGIYTPQVIVDGMTDVIGNQRDRVLAAIAQRASQLGASQLSGEEPVRMMVTVAPGHVIVDIGAIHVKISPDQQATVWIMRTLSHAAVHVEEGENKDRQLSYSNVVREMQRAGEWDGRAVTLDVPLEAAKDKEDGLAVILQSHDYGAVLGAALVQTAPSHGSHDGPNAP